MNDGTMEWGMGTETGKWNRNMKSTKWDGILIGISVEWECDPPYQQDSDLLACCMTKKKFSCKIVVYKHSYYLIQHTSSCICKLS